jgi:hypothetical protein
MKASDIAGKEVQFEGIPVPDTNQTKSQFLGSEVSERGVHSRTFEEKVIVICSSLAQWFSTLLPMRFEK